MKKVIGKRNYNIIVQLIGSILCLFICIGTMIALGPLGAAIMIIPSIMCIGFVIYTIKILVSYPSDIVIFEGDTITVYEKRNMSVSFKASDIEDTEVYSWGRGKINSNMTFKLKDNKKVTAYYVTNTDEIYNELLKLKKND